MPTKHTPIGHEIGHRQDSVTKGEGGIDTPGVDPPVSGDGFSESIDELTRALGDPTRREVYLDVRDHPDGTTVGEVADRFGIHPNVARHHLEKLVRSGFVEVRKPVADVGRHAAGRPSKRYAVSAKEVSVTLPHRDDHLLLELLLSALAGLPADDASGLAERAGEEYGRKLAARAGEPATAGNGEGSRGPVMSRAEVLSLVAGALRDRGFATTVDLEEPVLESQSCPFGELAAEHPQIVCALDRGMVRGMFSHLLGDSPSLSTTSRAEGDATCTTRL